MSNIDEQKLRKAIDLLEKLDAKLENMIMEIEQEKDRKDGRVGYREAYDTLNTYVVSDYIDTINSIQIEGNEDILIKINAKYNDAIKALKDAIQNNDPYYKKQFERELSRLTENKAINYDSIAETYKEISERLDRGEIQKDYFQGKANEKDAEIKYKEKQYKQKNGNIDIVSVAIKDEYDMLQQKVQIQRLYKELLDLNTKIENVEHEISSGILTEEEEQQKNQELEELKEKRKKAVEKFEEIATDKDGKKYKKEEGKSDKEYIDELDATKIREAIDEAVDKFKTTLSGISTEDAEITLLDKEMNESGTLQLSTIPINGPKDAEGIVKLLAEQKALWNIKAKEQGYDKAKLINERDSYQDKANNYDNIIQHREDESQLPTVDSGTTFKERYDFTRKTHGRIRSFFKSFFRKSATEQEMMNSFDVPAEFGDINIEESKKEALKYLTDNRRKLNELNIKDRKKKEFKDKLSHNVGVTEAELHSFWSENEKRLDDEEEER